MHIDMEQVAILTQHEYELLVGQEFSQDSFFNPVKDCQDRWIISSQEIEYCDNQTFSWVKQLGLSDWCGPYTPISGTTENYFNQFFSGQTNG